MAYNKTGSVSYSVIADTHGYPWGSRNADIDLGDNTMTTARGGLDPVEEIDPNIIKVYGNHDVGQTGKIQGFVKASDLDNKIVFYGLDSTIPTSTGELYVIPDDQIDLMAKDMETLDNNWDVIVLTHIPLFNGNGSQDGCWPSNAPTNAAALRSILAAFQNHTSVTVKIESTGATESYDFSNSNGYVIGCFAGHVHCHIQKAVNVDGTYLYMRTFTANGGHDYSETSVSWNAGMYEPDHNTIEIDFGAKTVDGIRYDTPDKNLNDWGQTFHDPIYGEEALGWFTLNPYNNYYPKFHPTGPYVGFNEKASGGAKLGSNGINDRYWTLTGDGTQLKIGNKTVTAKIIRFAADGGLRYYQTTANAPITEITNYKTTDISFFANDLQWNFHNGKYVHDKAVTKRFLKASTNYPVFDSTGRYLGWSGTRGGYLIGVRDSTTTNRTFSLGSGTEIYNNGSSLGKATQIRFAEDGKLLNFDKAGGGTITVSNTSNITFTADTGENWKFINRLYQK